MFLSPISYFLLPTSCFLLPASCFLLPTSYFLLPTSYFLLPTPIPLPLPLLFAMTNSEAKAAVIIKGVFARASRVLGDVSRRRFGVVFVASCHTANTCHPGLIVGILCIICNGLCTARRFHNDQNDLRCRIGCSDETDSVTH